MMHFKVIHHDSLSSGGWGFGVMAGREGVPGKL